MKFNQTLLLSLISISLLLFGCGSDENTINCENRFNIIINSITHSDCNENSGQIEISASGGNGVLQFSLDGITFQQNGTFENLAPGNFSIKVKDENDCTASSAQIEILQDNDLAINIIDLVPSNGCFESMGSISITASGGDGNYLFKINNGPFQEKNTFTDLDAGDHIIAVKDGNNCDFSQTVKVPSGVSFSQEIKPLFETNCVVSNCHNGDRASLSNFSNFPEIQNRLNEIKLRIENRTMPRNGSLTDDEIQLIVCWINDGGLNN